jgi:hypothetical protein
LRERRGGGEHRHPPDDAPLGILEQLIPPVERGAKRLVASGPRAGTGREQREPVVEPVEQLLRREHREPGGGQLQRERDPVEAASDRRQCRGVLPSEHEARGRRRGALLEQGDRGAGAQRGQLGVVRVRRDIPGLRERIERHPRLAVRSERVPARGQHPQPWARAGERLGERRDGVEDVLAVVEDEQHRAAGERGAQGRQQLVVVLVEDAEGLGDVPDDLDGGKPGELGDDDAVREPLADPRRRLQRQPGLARAARAQQRDDRGALQRRRQPPHVRVPSDEAGDRHRDGGGERAGWRPGRGDGRSGHGGRLRGRGQTGVLPQDRRLQRTQRRRRVDAQLLVEQPAHLPVGRQGLVLPAGPVQREHVRRTQPLPEGVRADEPVELRDQGGVLPSGQPRLEQRLRRRQSEFRQVLRLSSEPVAVREVAQRVPPPEPGRRCEQVRRDRRRRRARLVDEPAGHEHVRDVGRRRQHVSRRLPADGVGAAEHEPQVPHVVLQGVDGGRRGDVAPHRLDQALDRDELADVEGQGGEHGLALGPGQCRASGPLDVDGSE